MDKLTEEESGAQAAVEQQDSYVPSVMPGVTEFVKVRQQAFDKSRCWSFLQFPAR